MKIHTIYRAKMNRTLATILPGLSGRILDLAAGSRPSYWRSLNTGAAEVVSADLDRGTRVDFDQPLPWQDESFDAALCINALYIANDPVFTLKEMRRVVKKGGTVIGVVPFVFPEAREPRDYVRWTSEGLGRLCHEAGFGAVELRPFGGHFSAATFLIEPFLYFGVLRLLAHGLASILDSAMPSSYRLKRPCPLGYVFICTKTI